MQVVMFAINRPRMDVVAVIMMVLVPLTGVITMPEALAGLSDPNVVLIAEPTGDVDLARFACDHQLTLLPVSGEWFADTAQEIGMAQLIVPPTSRLIGQTAITARFRTAYDLSLIGLKQGSRPVTGCVIDKPLQAGDTLLTIGPSIHWQSLILIVGMLCAARSHRVAV